MWFPYNSYNVNVHHIYLRWLSKIRVMHRVLPWAGAVSTESVSGGSGTSSCTRISSSYSSMISSNSGSPVITISPNSFSMGVFGSRTRVDVSLRGWAARPLLPFAMCTRDGENACDCGVSLYNWYGESMLCYVRICIPCVLWMLYDTITGQ